MMPRDMDLMRQLMLQFERDDTSIPLGRSEEEVAYHVDQLIQGGLLKGHVQWVPSPGRLKPRGFHVHNITYAGHDFIAAIRNEGVWAKLKAEMQKRGAPMTIDALVFAAKELGKSLLGSL